MNKTIENKMREREKTKKSESDKESDLPTTVK